ncbi:DUF2470 domain-containing protein [Favolaschia claudopus]|uniref:DUF2470 domain-containing protein n=1 Tax=Favolaschia claudopus TaxID=2862362 RepID=A0AAW0BMF4_9AGAR
MTDRVAEKSSFLKMYMSSHPDTLVGYAKWYGKVAEPISSAEMSAINTKSMTLTCTLKNGTKKEVIVTIDPPLAGYEDVKPRLLEMKAISQEGLGMIKSPQITTFRLPPSGIPIASFFWFLLPYGAFSPTPDSIIASPWQSLFAPAHFLRSYIPQNIFKILWPAFLAFHGSSVLYTWHLCRKHRAPIGVTLGYLCSAFYIGVPVWLDLRRQIQDARIESVMKV